MGLSLAGDETRFLNERAAGVSQTRGCVTFEKRLKGLKGILSLDSINPRSIPPHILLFC